MPTNTAAWLEASRAQLTVGPADVPRAGSGEIVVRARAVAINPLDWIVQGTGPFTYRWLTYPAVLGTDIAGEVVEVGAGVTRFAVGDRVVGLATGTDRGRDPMTEGAFQTYPLLLEHLTSPIPAAMTDAEAAVLPLAISTAACALFQPRHLGLRLPVAHPAPAGEVVLVWGGSTSVGANAVQLARAAGYDVISTASPKNFDTVASYGAEAVVDYRSPTAVDELVRALRGRRLVGAVALGAGSAGPALSVLRRGGGKRLALASTAVSFDRVVTRRRLFPAIVPVLAAIGAEVSGVTVRARLAGVQSGFVWGSSLRDDDIGPAIWRDLLPRALEDGTIRPLPQPSIVGHGLDAIQSAMDLQRAGVSASKLVVTL